VNNVVKWFIWSSGREVWESIEVTNKEIATFVFLYTKTINNNSVEIYIDETGRYVGGFHL
jgi:hypothetical protein